MIRAALATTCLLALGACATQAADANPGSYTLERGLVTYDGMRQAKDDCAKVGGTIKPFGDGGDANQMSNYQCIVPPKGAKP